MPSQVNRTGMAPPLVMALLVSEKPLVLVALAGVPNPACRLDKSTDCPGDEVGPAAFDTGAAVVVVTS